MSNVYRNSEDSDEIICPYCMERYEPSYGDTCIGGKVVDCRTGQTASYVCDKCHKKFTMYGYRSGWYYHTETIDGEMTNDEWEELHF